MGDKIRIFTPETHPEHPIIKAAMTKGLTNITITWNYSKSPTPGWIIESDQVPWLRIHQKVATVVKKINAWQWEEGKLKT